MLFDAIESRLVGPSRSLSSASWTRRRSIFFPRRRSYGRRCGDSRRRCSRSRRRLDVLTGCFGVLISGAISGESRVDAVAGMSWSGTAADDWLSGSGGGRWNGAIFGIFPVQLLRWIRTVRVVASSVTTGNAGSTHWGKKIHGPCIKRIRSTPEIKDLGGNLTSIVWSI